MATPREAKELLRAKVPAWTPCERCGGPNTFWFGQPGHRILLCEDCQDAALLEAKRGR